jgi:ferredoxin
MADDERQRQDGDEIETAKRALRHAKEELEWAEEALDRAKGAGKGAALAQAPKAAPASSAPAPAPKAAAPAPAPAQPPKAPSPKGWRVEFERDNCIGAGACVAANADFWSIDNDGKANLRTAAYDAARKVWVLEIADDAQLRKQRDAAGVCPVNVIHIYDPEGKQEI